MFERFTKRARSAVEDAVRLAEEQQAAEVRPQHLFAAILRDPDNLAVRVLLESGTTVSALQAELARQGSRPVDGLGEEDAEALASIGIDLEEVLRRMEPVPVAGGPRRRGHRRFAKSSKKVLALSLREAIALGHNYIGTEHILLGLVRGADPVVRDTLTACGVAVDQLRPAVKDAVRKVG